MPARTCVRTWSAGGVRDGLAAASRRRSRRPSAVTPPAHPTPPPHAVTAHVRVQAARETGVLQDFYDMMSTNPARAFYGPGHVFAAADLGAGGRARRVWRAGGAGRGGGGGGEGDGLECRPA
jgi:hypothetical protein